MTALRARIDALDWPGIAEQLDREGHALIAGLFDAGQARALAALAGGPAAGGPCPAPAGHAPGSGELFYLPRPLPEPLASCRAAFHRRLTPIAERWNALLGLPAPCPAQPRALPAPGPSAGPWPAPAAISRLHEGDCQALHQHAHGGPGFPLQLVALCSAPGRDFTGGEFVMTEQRPRMQSRPIVLPMQLGDAAVIAVAHRPCRGARGIYRATLRHAVSRVRSGTRVGLELLLHDGP